MAIGLTLPRGFGVSLANRSFVEFNIEQSLQHSQYAMFVGQYSSPPFSNVTFNAGLGRGWHRFDSTPDIRSSGTAGSLGFALRFPAASTAALVLSGSAIKSLTGSANFHPLTRTIGVGLNVSTSSLRDWAW